MATINRTPQDLLRFAQTPQGKQDPHALYDSIRAITPEWRDEDSGMLYLFTWADCDAVMRSRDFGVPDLLRQSPVFERSAALQFLNDALSNIDPPRHTRLRGAVQKSFSAPVLKRSAAFLEALIAGILDDLRQRDSFDAVADYAAKIPNTVICEMLGVPREDHGRFEGWLAQQFRLLQPTPPSEELLLEVDSATQALVDYMADLIAERRRTPRTDLISELVAAEDAKDDPISTRDMTVTAAILLAGGSDTTKTAISIGTQLLLENPAQRAMLLENPGMGATAFEEIVRFGGAVILANSRKAHRDIEINGRVIRAGDFVVPVLAAANRDPAKFADPGRFDIGRHPNPHIAFGGGAHVCIGNMMARMVGGRAVMALNEAFPDLRPSRDTRDVNTRLPAMFGLLSLDVTRS